MEGLDAWLRRVPANAIDPAGKFVWQGGEAVFSFGKHQGKSLRDVAQQMPDYLEWILQSDFPDDAKAIVSNALQGDLPAAPD